MKVGMEIAQRVCVGVMDVSEIQDSYDFWIRGFPWLLNDNIIIAITTSIIIILLVHMFLKYFLPNINYT